MNRTFGHHLRLSVRGASHAREIRFTLEHFPKGLEIDLGALRATMERRAPGRDKLATARREADEIQFLSGVKSGETDGSPIRGTIANTDVRPNDYDPERTVPRPGHADFPQWVESGVIPTGGGSNSARLTAALVACGGICQQWLARRGIEIHCGYQSIGAATTSAAMRAAIEAAQRDGDSIGGVIAASVSGMPAGLGGALFAGIESDLAAALFAIPGVKGVEFGTGFGCTRLRGSEFNDPFVVKDGEVTAPSNRQGGILGGRTSGMPITFDVAFRPTPTIFKSQSSVDLATMQPATLSMKGRHDPCIAYRAAPIVEAMTAFVLADLLLADAAAHPRICLTLTGGTLEEDWTQYASQRYFTDMVEVRADLLSPSERKRIREFVNRLPRHVETILTFRRQTDGGSFAGAESTRITFFKQNLAAFDYVDFEDDFRVPALETLARNSGVRIVRSLHRFDGPVRNLAVTARLLVRGTDEIAKIAMTPGKLRDVENLFREGSRLADVPHVFCAMGRTGMTTRILAGRSNSLWTYASTGALNELGHLSPAELVRTYRLRTVSREARLFGITGFPLKVTRSPELHNSAFRNEDLDAVMVPFPSTTAREALEFMDALHFDGIAVTIPHKQAIVPLLDALDQSAKSVGAVNTVVVQGGRKIGYNTDVLGFAEAINGFVKREGKALAKLRIAVLGDGGAAQAVKAVLKSAKAKFTVFHRETPPPGYDLLINATPVDPILDYKFTGRELAYDLGYVPLLTPFLARAQAAGCKIENGYTMLVAQARAQREIWQA